MTSGSIRPPMTQTLSAVSRLRFEFCLPQVAHTEAGAPTASANLNLTPNLNKGFGRAASVVVASAETRRLQHQRRLRLQFKRTNLWLISAAPQLIRQHSYENEEIGEPHFHESQIPALLSVSFIGCLKRHFPWYWSPVPAFSD